MNRANLLRVWEQGDTARLENLSGDKVFPTLRNKGNVLYTRKCSIRVVPEFLAKPEDADCVYYRWSGPTGNWISKGYIDSFDSFEKLFAYVTVDNYCLPLPEYLGIKPV